MFNLEEEKRKLRVLEEAKELILEIIKECYRLDEDQYETLEDVDDAIICDELQLFWYETRDHEYIDSQCIPQRQLIRALQLLQQPNNQSKEEGKKAIEKIIENATRSRNNLLHDIKKDQKALEFWDEFLADCEECLK